MLLEGLKLMIVGMATVILFLLLLIACIEWVKFLTRNFTMNQQQSLHQSRKSDSNKYKTVPKLEVPVEVFAAAIASYESDNNTS
ncbi:MAG: OadG family protein [SAR324 cluster bacterium]|nr:OadG family protein [SAR324 cluster bacterium]